LKGGNDGVFHEERDGAKVEARKESEFVQLSSARMIANKNL